MVDAQGDHLATLLKVSGNGTKRIPAWRTLARQLPTGLGGQRVALELVAQDVGEGALIEAAVDQVRVTAH